MRLTDPLLQSYPPRSDDSCQNTVVSGATKKGTTVPPIIFHAGEHHPSFSCGMLAEEDEEMMGCARRKTS